MSRKKKYVMGLFTIALLVGLFIGLTKGSSQLNAKETKVDDVEITIHPITWKDDIIGLGGKLKYGISQGRTLRENTSPGFEKTVTWIPNVTYMDTPDKEIRHLYDGHPYDINGFPSGSASNGVSTNTTPGFNLVSTDDEYGHDIHSTGSGLVLFSDVKEAEVEQKTEITATGTKATDKDLEVSLKMKANEKNSQVSHIYEVTNTSDVEKTIYPFKEVDTQLNYDDYVIIYSRGEGEGLYIQGKEQPGRPDEKIYRLDYIMNTDDPADPETHQPLYYRGTNQSSRFDVAFGPDKENQLTANVLKDMNQPKDVEVLPYVNESIPPGQNGRNNDSGIYMSWGKVTLKKGETYKMRYDVGIKPMESLETSKVSENLTSKDGKNQVGDTIQYTIEMMSPKHGYEDVKFSDVIPFGFEQPKADSEVKVVNVDGSTDMFKMAEVYTANDTADGIGTLRLPKADPGYKFAPQDKMTIQFSVVLASDAAGKEIKNEAEITGISEGGSNFTDPIIDEEGFKVENPKPVTVKHVDMTGKPLVPTVKDLILTGIIGETKTISPQSISGYIFDHASIAEPLEVTISTNPQEVLLYYKENRFKIAQTVVDEDDKPAGDVKIDQQLFYKVTIDSQLAVASPIVNYKEFTITTTINQHLTEPKALKLVSGSDLTKEVGSVTYAPTTKTITAVVTSADAISSTDDLILTYEAKATGELNDQIKVNAHAAGEYENGMVASKVTATELVNRIATGDLKFVSAPSKMNYGEELKISTMDKVYSLATAKGALTVQDLRGVNNQWSMTARLEKVLTNDSVGHTLPTSMYYNKNGNGELLTTGADVSIVSHQTLTTDLVNISGGWSEATERPYIKVKGGAAKRGAYEAEILWTLHDTP